MKKFVLIAATALALVLPSVALGQAQYPQPKSRYEKAVDKGFCPVGLICRSYDKGVKAAVSTPGHPVHLPKDGAPPVRRVRSGDSLWSIATYFLGDGREWVTLCTSHPDNPDQLKIGEYVTFC